MQNLTRYPLMLLLCFLFISLHATTDPFSGNTDDFLQEMEAFIKASNNEKVINSFKVFKTNVDLGVIQEKEMQTVIEVSNIMLEKKMTASPYFEDYLNSVNYLVVKTTDEKTRQSWQTSLKGLLESIEGRTFTKYKSYLKFSKVFFEKGMLYYSKSGVNWEAKSDVFEMLYADDKPQVKFEEIMLNGVRKKVNITIQNTSGTYFPLENKWIGTTGTVDWKRHGDSDVDVTLNNYTVETKKGTYKASDAELSYPSYFGTTVLKGSLEDKLVFDNGELYPKFDSYDKDITFDKLAEGVTLKGGFSLHGVNMYMKGTAESPCTLELKNKNKPLLTSEGVHFLVDKDKKVSGASLNTVLHYNAETISHPSASIKYNAETKELNLFRGKKGLDRYPFYSSLHGMEIDVEKIDFVVGTNEIMIGQKIQSFIDANKKVSFKSKDFFDSDKFIQYQNVSDVNPISVLFFLTEKADNRELDANIYASKLNSRFNIDNIKSMLYDLVADGFIIYNKHTEMITVKDKVKHYVKAYQKQWDYDNIQIESHSDETHAVIDLGSNQILTNGVSKVELSDKQQVAFKPHKKQVLIGEDRSMYFDGKVFAGFSSMEGKDFDFNYAMNNIAMDSIRYFDLFLPDGTKEERTGKINAQSIASRIEHLNGILLIDAPKNKSGNEDLEGFPSLNTKGNSFVYYDGKDTQGGLYKRDNFYFELEPFHFNNLDSYTEADIHFKGTMVSGDIFPNFKETLLLREEDHSLGFTTNTPANGYALYKDKGNYKGEIDLSNVGVLGKGEFDYLWANIQSEDIIFRPEQLTCSALNFDLTEERNGAVQVPQVHGSEVMIDWRPQRDSMYIDSQKESFEIFKTPNHNLSGILVLTPGGLKGKGLFEWEQGIMTSRLFSFGAYSVQADTTNVRIKAFETEALAFDTKNVSADIDFDARMGHFKANDDESSTFMPYNQYITNLGDFAWDMKEQTITFTTDEIGVFTSTHPEQDSLTFEGRIAKYDFKNSILEIGDIKHINSADALIYPNKGEATIAPGGKMEILNNAKIVANTINKNHVINRATVEVLGKKEFKGSGFYEYNIGDKKQEIVFDNIVGMPVGKGKRSEKKMVTRATGEVLMNKEFYIDQKTKFYGTISLDAESKNLSFDGFAQLDAPNMLKRHWFRVQSEADKSNLIISYDTPKNPNGDNLHTGLFLSKENINVYPTVMGTLSYTKDRPILPATGVVKYDKGQDAFLFGDSLRVVGVTNRGNLITYFNDDSKVKAEGSFEVGPQLEGVKVKAAGQTETSLTDPSNMNFEFLAGVNMPIPEKLMKLIQADIAMTSFNAMDVNYTKPEKYTNALAEFITDDVRYKAADANLRSYRDLAIPAEDNKYDFVFSELDMKWDMDYQSFVSAKPKLGIVSVAGQNFNKYMEAYVEFKMPSNDDDRVYIYIKTPSDYYYFFAYKQGIISTTSNNIKYKQAVTDLKKKEAFVKVGKEDYEIQAVEMSTAESFIKRIQVAQKQ